MTSVIQRGGGRTARLIAFTEEIADNFVPVLTGAGASVAFGFPMMDQAVHLLSQHLQTLPESNRPTGASRRGRLKHYKGWIDEEIRNLRDRDNLETFLISLDTHISYLERAEVHGLTQRILGDLGSRPLIENDQTSPLQALKDLRFASKEFVHQEYGKRLSEEARNLATRAFTDLSSALAPRRFTLFTTNYDTVAEAVPAMLDKERVDGFASSLPEQPEIWKEPRLGQYVFNDRDLPVLHLHGAASWVSVDHEVRRYPGLGRLGRQGESLLIYPGRPGKDSDVGDIPAPSRFAYNCFTQTVAAQRTLVAIGYSFRDADIIRHIDRAAAYAGRSIHLCVIAPDMSPEVDSLFLKRMVRGKFIEARFEKSQTWKTRLRDWFGSIER